MSIIDKIMKLIDCKDRTQVNFVKNFNHPKVNKQTVTDWKSGKSKSYNLIISDLANYFDVSIDYLVNDAVDDELSGEEQELVSEFKKLDLKGKSAVMQTILNEQKRMNKNSISENMKETITSVENLPITTQQK